MLTMKIELDAMDAKILEILQQDARTTLAEIGRRIHMSQPAVAERVKRMEAANVICGYHARQSRCTRLRHHRFHSCRTSRQ